MSTPASPRRCRQPSNSASPRAECGQQGVLDRATGHRDGVEDQPIRRGQESMRERSSAATSGGTSSTLS